MPDSTNMPQAMANRGQTRIARSASAGLEPPSRGGASPRGRVRGHRAHAKPGGSRLRRLLTILFSLLIAGGLATLAALAGESWHARLVAEDSITQLSAKCESLDAEARAEVESQARAYNEALASPSPGDGAQLWPYEKQLLFDREPMMSFVEIPKIAARLPIYHGTSDAALMAGVGHYEQSSLPVGGQSSHCVLMGHSGMHGATMFDHLDQLQPGDVFVIWTLSQPYAYQVTHAEIVEPVQVASLGIEPGRDLVTLVTCTPYGVNSHRLLVHAQRCDYQPENTTAAVAVDARGGAFLAALAACALVAAIALAGAWSRRRKARATRIYR